MLRHVVVRSDSLLLKLSEVLVIHKSLSDHVVALVNMTEVSIASLRCPGSLCLGESGEAAVEVRVRVILNGELRGISPVILPEACMSSHCGGVDSDSSDGECESDDGEVSSCLEFGRETAVGQLGADGCQLSVVSSRVC
jgi:hypothetical protein